MRERHEAFSSLGPLQLLLTLEPTSSWLVLETIEATGNAQMRLKPVGILPNRPSTEAISLNSNRCCTEQSPLSLDEARSEQDEWQTITITLTFAFPFQT